jgi:hypothetical protein
MQFDLFVPELWTEVTTWLKDIQFMAMEITKASQVEFGA